MANRHPTFSRRLILISLGVVLVVALLAFVWYQHRSDGCGVACSSATSGSASDVPPVVNKTFCSDVCPQNSHTYRVYQGVTDKTACAKLGGHDVVDPAWGGYIGCEPR